MASGRGQDCGYTLILVGSLVGAIPETQEMLDHCGKHGITSDIEMIEPDQIDSAFERTNRGDVKYRFVIDCATLRCAVRGGAGSRPPQSCAGPANVSLSKLRARAPRESPRRRTPPESIR